MKSFNHLDETQAHAGAAARHGLSAQTVVLHLGKFYPPDNGGIESVTAALARGTAAAGLRTTVFCFEEHGRGDALDQGVQVLRVPAFKLASQPLSAAYYTRGMRLARQSDIVHVHLPNMLAAVVIARLPPGPKVVLHWHSDVVGKGLLAKLTRPIERAMLRRADRVVCTSQAYADASDTLRPFVDKVVVVPLGVPEVPQPPPSAAEARAALPAALRQHLGQRPLVLAVGRLVPYKGFDVLIDAAGRLSTDAAVVIVGGGPLYNTLRAQVVQANLGPRVLLTGRVDDATLAALQRLTTVYCMPSVERSEAFGVALAEALALGLPAVATQIAGSGVPWVNLHGVTGLNVTPGNAAALATALDRLLNDGDLRVRMALGARQRYETLFTESQSIARTLDVYRQLLMPIAVRSIV